ncbi:hypothetical protein [Paenibacillus kobensis]|nr:hypothetical protein [Paenibacillus kobensis]
MKDKKPNVIPLPRKPAPFVYKSQDVIMDERKQKRESILDTILKRGSKR